MIGTGVELADAILRGHGIQYVVVGGQAVARTVRTGTVDVDVMVTTADFEGAVAKLLKDPRIRLRAMREGVALLSIESAEGAALDVLDSAPFAGTHSGAEFYRFLETEESSESSGIRYASTAIVWYTRLLTSRWKLYAEKILVNVGDGADAGLLEKAERIAQRFGTLEAARPRLEYIRTEIRQRSQRPRERLA
ncbi:MAG TPA: hypothetical protein VGU43_04900 [Thermoplasmata archaeon]|nr:hypothetical protein [Thermoplasmata archaeon]